MRGIVILVALIGTTGLGTGTASANERSGGSLAFAGLSIGVGARVVGADTAADGRFAGALALQGGIWLASDVGVTLGLSGGMDLPPLPRDSVSWIGLDVTGRYRLAGNRSGGAEDAYGLGVGVAAQYVDAHAACLGCTEEVAMMRTAQRDEIDHFALGPRLEAFAEQAGSQWRWGVSLEYAMPVDLRQGNLDHRVILWLSMGPAWSL